MNYTCQDLSNGTLFGWFGQPDEKIMKPNPKYNFFFSSFYLNLLTPPIWRNQFVSYKTGHMASHGQVWHNATWIFVIQVLVMQKLAQMGLAKLGPIIATFIWTI